jgi:UDP-N-acetylmuramoyl-tripeptide--D-alanyl-D-alanine ligase
MLLMSPISLLIADRINTPIEQHINKQYIEDARRILASNPDLVVIGVTGSFGKTSVKHFLHRLLSAKYNVFMTPGNYNTTLGVVRAVREGLRPTHDIFLCEMGARNVGDIKEICDLAKPTHGVVTAVGPQHLESFGSFANIIGTKFELVDSLPENGTAFLNYDSEDIRHRDVKGNTATYCLEPGTADYVARDVRVSDIGSSFTVTLANGQEVRFETRLIGRHNVLNVAAAIAVADRLGVQANDLVVAVRRLESVPHRLELRTHGDLTIIDDAYNSNAAGAKAALYALAMFEGFRILVTPGMVELGAMEESLNREFGTQAASRCDCAILVGEKRTRPIRDGLLAGGMAAENIHAVETIEQAFAKIYAAPSGGRHRIVLLENDLPDNY